MWATAEEDHTVSGKNGQLRLHFTQVHQNCTIEDSKKILAARINLDFYCKMGMLGSEFTLNDMKSWIHPATYQWFRLVVVV